MERERERERERESRIKQGEHDNKFRPSNENFALHSLLSLELIKMSATILGLEFLKKLVNMFLVFFFVLFFFWFFDFSITDIIK